MSEAVTPNVIGADGTRPPVRGYDHEWFDYRPIVARTPVSWPQGARTAVSVVIQLNAPEWESSPPVEPRAAGGRGLAPSPDFPRMSHREFGHRVGALRLAQQLYGRGIEPAVAVDVLTAEQYPSLLAQLPASEHIAAGLSASRPVTSAMGEDEEADYIELSLERLAVAVGTRPVGWIGPERSQSGRTPRLLAAAGLEYMADWGNDDVPYPAPGAGPDFWSCPFLWELSDEAACFHRGVAPDTWARSVMTAFDRLHAEGGRMLTLHLQPWVSGQAYRAASVDAVLAHLSTSPQVWFAPPRDIVAHCKGLGA